MSALVLQLRFVGPYGVKVLIEDNHPLFSHSVVSQAQLGGEMLEMDLLV